jgi:hypothetical protein
MQGCISGGLNAKAPERSIRIGVPPSVRLFVEALQLGCSRLLWSVHKALFESRILPANQRFSIVEPRGLEPLTSAVQRRRSAFLCLLTSRKFRISKPNRKYTRESLFCCFHLSSTWVAARLLHRTMWYSPSANRPSRKYVLRTVRKGRRAAVLPILPTALCLLG